MKKLLLVFLLVCCVPSLTAQRTRYVIVDQDGAGPGGSDQQSILLLLQSPEVTVLGITMVSGDVWEEQGVLHTLRMLELVGRTDVPVIEGARSPLIRAAEDTRLSALRYGKTWYMGALGPSENESGKGTFLKEGTPVSHPVQTEDAAHFIISMVHKHPHEVTIFCGGPLTNIALALRLDPSVATLARELVLMGGSLNPETDDPEFTFNPRHEFNFWFDPEAAHIVLTAPWNNIVDTTVDVSIQAKLSAQAKDLLARSSSPAALYVKHYPSTSPYLWDELAAAAWIDPGIIKSERKLYLDVNLDHGFSYGDTLTWSENSKPVLPLQEVHVQTEVDAQRFEQLYVARMSSNIPR
jgi:purine nucleosidase